MRTGNPLDGMYFLLLFIPMLLSIYAGDIFRKRIVSHLLLVNHWNRNVSSCAGIFSEVVIIMAGVLAGFFLVKQI